MDTEIIRLLKKAKEARNKVFNNKYAVEACLQEVCAFTDRALELALEFTISLNPEKN